MENSVFCGLDHNNDTEILTLKKTTNEIFSTENYFIDFQTIYKVI